MSDPFTAAKATIKVGEALIAVDRSIRKGALQDQLDEAERRLNANVGQVAYAVCKALVAVALDRPPSHDEVDAYMAGAVNDPTFPARAHRLLGEARKTASERRRHILAAVLFGRSFEATPEADRERVDMLVERLTSEDIALLGTINSLWQRQPDGHPQSACLAAYWQGLRLLRFPTPGTERLTSAMLDATPITSRTAFAALQSAGCIDVRNGFSSEGFSVDGIGMTAGEVDMTSLGVLLLDALEAVRAGIEAPQTTDGSDSPRRPAP